jgi:hypothetical protein
MEAHQEIGRGGSTSQEVFFNARPNSLYCCWVNSSASVSADNGFWGFSNSAIDLHIVLVAVYVE